jgi:uncharacterized protein (TIGR03086 family)
VDDVGVNVEVGERHLAVCRRFSEAVVAADGKWERRSPCAGWDARAVLEHVIGFHDVLLLRPLGLKPDRPRNDPGRRWDLTVERLRDAFGRDGLFERSIEVPAVANNAATRLDAAKLVPRLTQDVLAHTWDLARAVDADDRLDSHLCAVFFDQVSTDPMALTGSGMFAPPVGVDDDVDIQSKFLARLGRDPSWRSVD